MIELGMGASAPGGAGTLNITNGGSVNASNITYLWTAASSINGQRGTFITGSLYGDTGTSISPIPQ